MPARRTGCDVEPELVTLITADVAGHDALPLVSAALAEVWERRDGDKLGAARYLEIGGIAAAVERLGGRAIERAGAEGVRDVMLRLVDVTEDGEWVRRRIAVADVPVDAAPALDVLVDERLVVRDEDSADVVHEVVFRAWPQLANWLDEARVDLVLDRELRAAARTWNAQGRNDDDVLRGARLAAAAEFATRRADVAPIVREFVAAGQQAADEENQQVRAQLTREVRARRRLGRALGAAAVLLVLALVGGLLALVSQRRADDNRQRAAAAAGSEQIGRLVAESGRLLQRRLDLALLLAVEANRREDNAETRGALLTALNPNPSADRSFLGFLAGPTRTPFVVDASDDGRVVASAGFGEIPPEGMVIVYDAIARTELGRMTAPHAFQTVDVSSDGRYVLAHNQFEVQVFESVSGASAKLPVPPPPAGDLAAVDRGETSIANALLRPGRKQFVVVTSDGVMTMWDLDGNPIDATLPAGPTGYIGFRRATASAFVDFDSDGTLRVIERSDDAMSAVWWDIDRGEAVRTVSLEDPDVTIWATATSSDGALMAGYEPDGGVFVWDLATGALRGDPADRPAELRGLAFDPTTPTVFAAGLRGGGIALHDVSTERQVGSPLLGQGSIGTKSVTFAADGHRLFSLDAYGLVGIWGDLGSSGLVNELLASGVASPEPSADGSRLLVAVDGARLEVRAGADPSQPGVEIAPPGGGAPIVDATAYELSADGSTVVAFTGGDTPVVFVADSETGETLWSTSDLDVFDANAASLNADGSRVIVADRSLARLRMWDVATGQLAGELRAADVDPDAEYFNGRPQFSPDGTSVDVVTFAGVARLSATDLRPVRVVAAPFLLQGDVGHVPGTDDVIASAVAGQIARVDMADGELVATGRSPDPSALYNVAVSSDGSLAVAGQPFSSRLAVFDAATLHTIGEPIPVGHLLFAPQFTPSGLLGNGRSDDLTRWDMAPAAWLTAACLAAGRDLSEEEWDQYIGADEPYRETCPADS